MDLNNTYLIVSTASLIVMAYLAVRDFFLKRGKTRTEQDVNVSTAVKNLSDALNLSSTELVESLTDAAKLRDELEREKAVTRKRIDETAEHRAKLESETTKLRTELEAETAKNRAEMEERIRETEARIENLNRDYLKETQRLQDENLHLRKQIDELEIKYSDIDRKYGNSKVVIEKLIKALKDAEIPLPDMNGGLSDSIQNWRWPGGKP